MIKKDSLKNSNLVYHPDHKNHSSDNCLNCDGYDLCERQERGNCLNCDGYDLCERQDLGTK